MDSFKTIFPPLLIGLQQQQAFLRDLSAAVLEGGAVSLPASPWAELLSETQQAAARLKDPELVQDWEQLNGLHAQFLIALAACEAAIGARNAQLARQQLDRLFGLSSALIDLLVAASLREITQAFSLREKRLAQRYEEDFLDAARIGRFAVRASDQTITDCDASFARLFGLEPAAMRGLDARRFIGAAAWKKLAQGARPGETVRVAISVVDPAGVTLSLEIVGYAQSGRGGAVHCLVVDTSRAQEEAQQRRLLSTAIDASDQMVLITDAQQQVVYVNAAFSRNTGYASAEVIGRTPTLLQGPDTSQATRVSLREALSAGTPAQAEVLNYRKSGEPYWVELSIVPVASDAAVITHWIAIGRDITQRKAQEQEITRLAMEDYLTGLPNRRAAEARLAIEWNRARRESGTFAVALADIDRFKLVNDQYGHQTGDQALTHVAGLLSGNMRGGDWIARWGGEEFLICFHDLDARGALTAGERARKLMKSRPLKLAQTELPLTISIGVALYQSESESLDALLAQADSLLYEAKQGGRDKVLCAGVAKGRKGSVIWEGGQVQSALQEQRVLAAFQPIVDLRTGATVAEEALARIVTRDETLIPAERFIVAAEQLHLISAIDSTVSRTALERGALAAEQGNGRLTHFINLSLQFLADAEQVDQLLDQVRSLQMIEPRQGCDIVIEITERQGGDLVKLNKHLKPLINAGLRLAVDDFGSGYSSFLYLVDLPVSFLKIEGWMVNRIVNDTRVRQLVGTIVNTAQQFKLTTVAECVEDAQSAQVLCDLGVDWAQGYFFAEPLVPAMH